MNMKKYLMVLPYLAILYASVFGIAVSADDSLTVRVGMYENNPKIFTDNQGNPSGFWPDIIEYIASEEGWEIEYIHGTWAECLTRLEKNEIDIMPDVAYTEERSRLYNFSNETVYTSWSLVYAREGSDIQSILNLEGKNIAVMKGSVNVEGPEGIKELTKSFGIDCTFTEVDSYTEVFELVDSGEADAGVTSKDFGFQHEADFNVVRTTIIFRPARLYFAFPKESSLAAHLSERIDYHMKELKKDEGSIYYQSLEKRLGLKLIEKPIVPEWIKWVLIGIGGLAFLLAGGGFILRHQVRTKTRELREEVIERKQAQEELARSEEKYSTLVEKGNDGIVVLQDGVVKFANSKMLEITGFSRDETIGKSFLEFVSPQFRALVVDRYKKRISGETVAGKYEISILAKSARETPVDINASQIDFEGKPADMAIIRDITERKKAEDELNRLYLQVKAFNVELEEKVKDRTKELEIAVKAAEAANRAKSDFLASMSHELRTPLNAIIGFSEVLREQYFGELNDKQREYVNDVLESGKHLLSLINDILDISKIEAGKLELDSDAVNIKTLLEGSLVMIKEKAVKHGIKLSINLPADLDGLVIKADERKLKQVMFNLLSNAAKFTPDGGSIIINVEKAENELNISVTDSGIGIPLEKQSHIFEEFYQVKQGTVYKTPGTGLGLAITKRIVELHGGRIWFYSAGEGKGSSFTFSLPVND